MKLFRAIGSVLKFINDHFKAFLFLLIVYLIFGGVGEKSNLNTPNLTTIDINGAIMDARELVQKISTVKKDSNIKGVLLYVNSPGGALAPSVEISYAIKDLRKSKPVVAYAAGTMASGSYYSSIWSNKIYANPGAFIGSIGVIMQGYDIKPLADKIGIKTQTVKAGLYKEAGTFMRPWTEAEKGSLEQLVQKSYSLFVDDVAKARDLNVSDKDNFANAKVFLSNGAKKVGLIDEIGSLEDAKKYLEKISNVKNPTWEQPDKFDKFMKKITDESTKSLVNMLFSLKTY